MFEEKKFNQDILDLNQEIEKRINHTQYLINQAVLFSQTDKLAIKDAQEIVRKSDNLQHNLDLFKQTSSSWLVLVSKNEQSMTPDDKSLMASLAIKTTLLYELIIEMMMDFNTHLQKVAGGITWH